MSEELEKTEETTTPPKKLKKGFSLSESTILMLKEKAESTGYNQSAIVDSVLDFGIPAFGENGMGDAKIISMVELQEMKAELELESLAAIEDFDLKNVGIREPTEPAIPVPEPAPMRRGRREKLKVPGLVGLPQQVVDVEQQQKAMNQVHPQAGGELYRPNLGSGPVAYAGVTESEQNMGFADQPGTHTPMAGNERLASLEANMNLLIQYMSNLQQPVHPQQPQAPVDINPYNQTQAPQPPPVFAASYPPGYTGPPGVQPGVAQPPIQQGMYPPPTPQGQRQDLQDAYAMNMGAGQGNPAQGGLTAQGLLSGAQNMNPNVAGQNINMEVANRALGPGWRDNLHRMNAVNRREQ